MAEELKSITPGSIISIQAFRGRLALNKNYDATWIDYSRNLKSRTHGFFDTNCIRRFYWGGCHGPYAVASGVGVSTPSVWCGVASISRGAWWRNSTSCDGRGCWLGMAGHAYARHRYRTAARSMNTARLIQHDCSGTLIVLSKDTNKQHVLLSKLTWEMQYSSTEFVVFTKSRM